MWFSAATSDMRLKRQLHIQAKELLSEFQDVPRLLVSTSEFGAKCIWDPGGISATAAYLDWPETYQNRGSTLKLTSKFHETFIQSLVLLLKPAKEVQAGYEWLISNY